MMMLKKTAKLPKWVYFVVPLVIVLGAGAGVGGHFLKVKYLDPRPANIETRQSEDFQHVVLEADIVNAGDAATVVVLEKEYPVKKGKVALTLPIGPVRLGHNEIEGLLKNAEGKERGGITFEFDLDRFWQPVLGNLGQEPPWVTVSFQTLPDNVVLIDGQPAPGGQPGQYEWNKAVKDLLDKAPPATGKHWIIELDWEMKPKKGKSEKGVMKIEIPAVRLQVNRPAAGAKVVDEFVECTGLTEEGTEIRVNGAPVDVSGTVFATKVPLPKVGDHKIVIDAFNPHRGPSQRTVSVVRVESLDAEIEEYEKTLEPDMGWENLARDPTSYKGKRVSLHGRIISFKTTSGVSAFQLLVDEGCPQEARCMVKVDFKGETSAGKDSWVTVLGEVGGKFTVETSEKKKFDVPSVQAAFVVRDEDKKGKKKKKKKGK
jgi:hypothetical protein